MSDDSAEMAGGTAYGVNVSYRNADEDVIETLSNLMLLTGEVAQTRTGMMLGHIKMAIDAGTNGGMTLNLTDMDTGVERHGSIAYPADLEIRFMAALLDVKHDELEDLMDSTLSSNGFTVLKKKHDPHIIELK